MSTGPTVATLLMPVLVMALFSSSVSAQVVLDGTLGPAGPLAGPNYDIGAELGRQVGGNLFHSFGQFDVGTGESATFSGPASVSNVIGRVTGGSASNIDGAIRSTIPSADLFLINPAGMVFGPNATLDVQGSFHASTANEIRFPDGGVFSASNPGASVLTTAPPTTFGFLNANPSALVADGGILVTPEDRGLSLVGGDIVVTGGTLQAPGGRLELTSLGGPGAVPIGSDDFDIGSVDRLGTITLTDLSGVNSSSTTEPGPILVRAGDLVMTNSVILSENFGADPAGAVTIDLTGNLILSGGAIVAAARSSGAGGDLTIRAASVTARAGAALGTVTNFSGAGGDLVIETTGDIVVTGRNADFRSSILARAFDSGPAGNARVSAEMLQITDGARFFNSSNGAGSAGNLAIEVDRLVVTDGGRLQVDSFSTGAGAQATITASESVIVDGRLPADGRPSRISVDSEITQLPGRLTIFAPVVEVTEGARIRSVTFGSGPSGSVTIEASERVLVSGRNGFNRGSISTETIGAGAGGDIFIAAPLIQVADSALIVADSFGAGEAGTIDLQVERLELSVGGIVSTLAHDSGDGGLVRIVADDITIIGGLGTDGRIAGINGNSSPPAPGQPPGSGEASGRGGTIEIVANTLNIFDGGFVSSGARDSGDGGAVRISLNGALQIAGVGVTGARSAVASTARATGNGGSIAIDAPIVLVSDGGAITADTSAAGNAGDVEITAGQLSLDQGAISSRSTSSEANAGRAGSIMISSGNLRVGEGSEISTSTTLADGGDIALDIGASGLIRRAGVTTSVGAGEGSGGNIAIRSGVLALDQGTIEANAFGGPGGNILIVTDSLIASPDSVIEASSELGVSGTISIESPDVDLTSSVTLLPSTLADVAAELAAQCEARGGKTLASFVGIGRGALPVQPSGGHLAYYLADQGPGEAAQRSGEVGLAAAPVTLKIECVS